MGKLINKIKKLIQKIVEEPEPHKENNIVHDISDIEFPNIEKEESEKVINISNKQFGKNNVVREMTEDDEKEIQKRILEMKQRMQSGNRSSKEFRKSYEIKEGTTIKNGDVTINFGKGNIIGNGNVMRTYKEDR